MATNPTSNPATPPTLEQRVAAVEANMGWCVDKVKMMDDRIVTAVKIDIVICVAAIIMLAVFLFAR